MIVTNSNLTLQTYDGILCHCGEKAFDEYRPSNIKNFDEFMEVFEKCYVQKDFISMLRPSTLEGCVVRISDMIDKPYFEIVKPMMRKIYEKMRSGIENREFHSPIFQHHLNHSIFGNCYRKSRENRKIVANIDDIVVDYIASMTDDYFLDLFVHEFKNDELCEKIRYVPYF